MGELGLSRQKKHKQPRIAAEKPINDVVDVKLQAPQKDTPAKRQTRIKILKCEEPSLSSIGLPIKCKPNKFIIKWIGPSWKKP